jgi:hypothetical protein
MERSMQCMPSMRDISQQPSSSVAGAPQLENHHPSRLVRFGREHPGWTVAGLVGAGLVGGLEMAAGVLLGAGVVALLRRPNDISTTEGPAGAKGRVREFLDRAPHDLRELKARARAVMLAARGETSVAEAQHEKPATPETDATRATPA